MSKYLPENLQNLDPKSGSFKEALLANLESIGEVVNNLGNENIRVNAGVAWRKINLDGFPYIRSDKTDGEYIFKTLTLDRLQLNTSATPVTLNPGQIQWNPNEHTYDLAMMNGTVQQVGEELFFPVTNKTGSTIPDGCAVMFAGTSGNSGRLLIAPMLADGTYDSKYFMGVVTHEIEDGEDGLVTFFGKIRKIDTTGQNGETWSDGDILYVSPTDAGSLTNVMPNSPNNIISACAVVHAHSNGNLFVRPTFQEKDIESATAKIGNVAGGNYSEIESDGTYVAHGDATVWVDIDFPIIVRTTGTGIPTLSTVQGNITAPQWQVGDFNVCEGQEFIHAWKEGSEVRWHVHMLTNGQDTTDRYVKWQVEWFWVNPNAAISASNTQSYEFKIPANTPTKTMFIVPIYQWTPTDGKIGGHAYARLSRITSTGTAPTSDPWCTMLQLHIECDTFGSREHQTK